MYETSSIISDVTREETLRMMIYIGVLYFILSHKSFKRFTEVMFKSIPIVGRLYIFPHLMNTAIFLVLVYVVKYIFDRNINNALIKLNNLLPTIAKPVRPGIVPTPPGPSPPPNPDPHIVPPIPAEREKDIISSFISRFYCCGWLVLLQFLQDYS